MVSRHYWIERIEAAWRGRNVVWLSGVRRSGKTFLARSLPDVEVLDCESPSVRRRFEDPDAFWRRMKGCRVVLDEVHRLDDPSEVLKLAADHHPDVFVVATGSSTLGAGARFRDTLTGRKRDLWLTPMIDRDLGDFDSTDSLSGDLDRRFLHGGLPAFFLAEAPHGPDFDEWIDSYWARDIQSLFRLERRHAFQKLLELILMESGGIFDATRFALRCEASRQTITNYLAVLEATHVAHVVRPYSHHKPSEIVSAPKVYGFDTGFVCAFRDWDTLRPEDRGALLEHLVLNELHGGLQTRRVNYWRDKRGHELDFVLPARPEHPIGIECKRSENHFDPAGFFAFHFRYPGARFVLVTLDTEVTHTRSYDEIEVTVTNLANLVGTLVRSGWLGRFVNP